VVMVVVVVVVDTVVVVVNIVVAAAAAVVNHISCLAVKTFRLPTSWHAETCSKSVV
jgi:hypothetical protein